MSPFRLVLLIDRTGGMAVRSEGMMDFCPVEKILSGNYQHAEVGLSVHGFCLLVEFTRHA